MDIPVIALTHPTVPVALVTAVLVVSFPGTAFAVELPFEHMTKEDVHYEAVNLL